MTTQTFEHWTLSLLAFSKRKLVTIDSRASVSDALAVLHRENLLAAPIWDEERREFLCLASLSDLTALVAFGCFQDDVPECESFRIVDQRAADWIMGLEGSATPLVIRPSTDTIHSVLPLLSSGVHQLLVQMEDGEYRIVSQTDVLRFLGAFAPRWRHAAWSNQEADKPFPLADILSKTLAEAGLARGHEHIVTVPTTVTALEAFRLLDHNHLRAAPVVDADRSVVTTISVSDMRGLRSSNLKLVKRPLLDFLQNHRGDFHLSYTIHVTDKVQTALLQFMSVSVHRLWIVDDARKVQGALSMTDMIRVFAEALAA